ncbi:beta-galactosidase 17 [Tanacetum coccineum]
MLLRNLTTLLISRLMIMRGASDAPISESGDVDGAKFKDRDLSTKAIESENSISMEVVGQMFRFLLYASEYTFKVNGNTLSIPKVYDK